MAKKTTKKVHGYEITIPGNPNFCGVDAGGVQFAYGKAQIDECRMVEWFKEHEGYEVKEIEEAVNESDVGGEAE